VTVNAGPRLDRLPSSSIHRRILFLIAVGMFFDGFDVYLAATVLGATLHSGFSTLTQNAQFVSVTFLGMMLGSLLTGFLGDRYGRRFTYQANLAVFGTASILAAFVPNMNVLIFLRGIMGLGLGAEIVVGFGTLTEFVPPQARGKWLGVLSATVVSSLPISALCGTLLIPRFGWRIMFLAGGFGALVVWYLRKALPESPRWLESVGRFEEAEALLRNIEAEVAATHTLPSAAVPEPNDQPTRKIESLLSPELFPRMLVGAATLITANTLIYGFVTWLPTFFVQEGRGISSSFFYSLLISLGAPAGSAIGALTADSWGRKRTIIGASLATILLGTVYPLVHNTAFVPFAGFLLMIPIYVQVTLLFAIYVPELFPTDIRLRASGICNTLGRGATIVTPFFVVLLFRNYGFRGVLAFLTGLLILQIIVVSIFGVETRKRGLEKLVSEASSSEGSQSRTLAAP
jgi:MFS transporter, putative metabolite:H+ symporter